MLKVKKLHPKAVLPYFATPGANGMDLTATEISLKDQYLEVKIGLAFEIPVGYVGLLCARSSISKTDWVLSNSVGILDNDYRGEVSYRFKHIGHPDMAWFHSKQFNIGDRIGQLVLVETPKMMLIQEVSELSDTERDVGAYGSTNK